jgi:hypothetical protein
LDVWNISSNKGPEASCSLIATALSFITAVYLFFPTIWPLTIYLWQVKPKVLG